MKLKREVEEAGIARSEVDEMRDEFNAKTVLLTSLIVMFAAGMVVMGLMHETATRQRDLAVREMVNQRDIAGSLSVQLLEANECTLLLSPVRDFGDITVASGNKLYTYNPINVVGYTQNVVTR